MAVWLLALLVLVDRHHRTADQRQLAFAGWQFVFQPVEFLAEIGDVLERAIHRRVTHVADVVELAQFRHDQFADAARRQFAFGRNTQLPNHRAHRSFDALLRDRPLVERAVETGAQLARIERLAPAVALDDRRQFQFHRFYRREPLATRRAFATPADGRAFLRNARVDHAGVDVLAERTMHYFCVATPKQWE